jgi:hypothetical protein
VHRLKSRGTLVRSARVRYTQSGDVDEVILSLASLPNHISRFFPFEGVARLRARGCDHVLVDRMPRLTQYIVDVAPLLARSTVTDASCDCDPRNHDTGELLGAQKPTRGDATAVAAGTQLCTHRSNGLWMACAHSLAGARTCPQICATRSYRRCPNTVPLGPLSVARRPFRRRRAGTRLGSDPVSTHCARAYPV